MGAQDISLLNLALGYVLLIIPLAVFGYYKTGLVKDTVIAFVRMTIQLFLVGIYLKWLFQLNNWLVNLAWAVVMVLISALTIGRRTKMNKPVFLFAFFISVFISIVVIDLYFLGIVIDLKNILDAKYFIPITGMILGNYLRSNVIALNSYYKSLQNDLGLYKFILANGGSQNEALAPFIKDALIIAFNPSIANTAITGLIALPGMMTGQLLGGSLPIVAIKYQIMMMITIFVGALLSVFLTIVILNRFIFDEMGMLKFELFSRKSK